MHKGVNNIIIWSGHILKIIQNNCFRHYKGQSISAIMSALHKYRWLLDGRKQIKKPPTFFYDILGCLKFCSQDRVTWKSTSQDMATWVNCTINRLLLCMKYEVFWVASAGTWKSKHCFKSRIKDPIKAAEDCLTEKQKVAELSLPWDLINFPKLFLKYLNCIFGSTQLFWKIFIRKIIVELKTLIKYNFILLTLVRDSTLPSSI